MYHAMAFDEARGETVVFGGHSSTAFGDTWAYGIMPAVFDTHGSSCAGGLLLSPRLSGTPPWSGEVFRLDLTSLPLGISLPWLDSDLLPSALPLPPNCSLYVLPSLFLPVVLHPASFSASTSFLMPADQALIGSRFAGQAASVAVPAGTMGLTNAGVGRIQSRR